MDFMPDKQNQEFLNADEVSGYLRIPRSTIYRLTQIGKIKAVKIGRHWRYIKSDIQNYLYPGKESLAKSNSFVERRVFPRINSSIKCRYSIILPPFKEYNGECLIKNIGAGGIFLFRQNGEPDEIEIDDPVMLQFLLISDSNQKINISAKGRVIWKNQNGCGIKFKGIDKEMHNRIIEYAD